MKRSLSLLVIVAMIVSLFPVLPATTQASAIGGARAVFGGEGGTELFLGGNYIELGISNWGDFGTKGAKPANFRGTDKNPGVGMSADHDGYGQGLDKPVDYYLPGTPEERFAVGYKVGGSTFAQSNSSLMNTKQMPTTLTNNSDLENGLLKATVVSTWAGKMEITQVISFKVNDKYYRNEVTIKNLSDQTYESARFMRSLDPDNSVFQGGSYSTANTVTHTVAEDGRAVVKAETFDNNDPMYKAFNSRIPFFFYSSDPRAVASVFGFINTDPYEAAAYDTPSAKGNTIQDDIGITLTWDSAKLAPSQSKSFVYFTSLDERDFSEVEAEIIIGEGGSATEIVESSNNDGSLTGKQKVVISGAEFKEELDKTGIRINNLPPGLDFDFVRKSSTEIEISFTGNAVRHNREFSVKNASVSIGKENLVDAAKGLTSETFNITFIDPARIVADNGVVSESVYGSGVITDSLNITLTNGKFAADIAAADVFVNHLPEGLDTTVTRVSDSQIKIDFTGTANSLNDVFNTTVTINSKKIAGSHAPLTTNTFKINFEEAEPLLTVQTPVLFESDLNDGSVSDKLIMNLVNGIFGESISASDVNLIGFPSGLSVGSVERTSSTQITISIAGNVPGHSVTESVYDAQVSVAGNQIISPLTEGLTEGIESNTFAILFQEPLPIIEVSPDVIGDNEDGSISETLTVSLKNGTFKEDVAGGIVVNNLPEGLEISVVRISATELKVSFVGKATKKDMSSAFASITADHSIVDGAEASMTSNNFNLDTPKDSTLAALDKDLLTWELIRKANLIPNEVKTELDLITAGRYGSAIVWTSSNEAVISTAGIVTRPAYEEGDKTITLKATIASGDVTVEKEFVVTVKKMIDTDEQAVNEDKSSLTWDVIRELNERPNAVRTALNLPQAGENDTEITWTSSNEDVISATGTVNRPTHADRDQTVNLTATIKRGDVVQTKLYVLTIKALPADAKTWLAEDADLLAIGYAEGDHADSVTQHVTLPAAGANGTNIVWTSNYTDVVSAAGVVNRKAGDTKVRLTARLSMDGFFRDKDFYLLVKGTSTFNLRNDADQLEVIFGSGDDANHVTKNVFLPRKGESGSDIEWSATPEGMIDPLTGKVMRPGPGQGDQMITLTAILKNPANPLERITKVFVVNLKEMSNSEAVKAAARNLTIANAFSFGADDTWESITTNFLLLQTGDYGAAIAWSSNNENVVDFGGLDVSGKLNADVNRPQTQDATVILTATLTVGDASVSKSFLLVVKNKSVNKAASSTRQTNRTSAVNTGNTESPSFKEELVNVLRTTLDDGRKVDAIIMDDAQINSLTERINPTDPDDRNRIVTILMDQPVNDKSDEMAFEIPGSSVSTMAGRNANLEIATEEASIRLQSSVLAELSEQGYDLYFRIIPVMTETEQRQALTQVHVNPLVHQAAAGKEIVVLSHPRKIETNYKGFKTKVVFPLKDIEVPSDTAQSRDDFLNSLRVFIEHSDGTKALLAGDIVFNQAGEPTGIEIEIEKFSRFQIIQFKENNRSSVVTPQQPASPVGVTAEQADQSGVTLKWNPVPGATSYNIYVDGVLHASNVKDSSYNVMGLAAGKTYILTVTAVVNGVESKQSESVSFTVTTAAGQHMKYIEGYPGGVFMPERNVTREEVAAILFRIYQLADADLTGSEIAYTDVSSTNWSADEIAAVTKADMMNGYPDGTFRPKQPITREEMASLAARLKQVEGNGADRFLDISTSWARDAINAANQAGLITGYTDGTFRPKANTTRAETVTLFNRLLNRGPLTGVTTPSWTDVSAKHWAYGHIEEASTDHHYVIQEQGEALSN
ncbi:immunoglobulin-like domain-containing protein [Paenibacillus sp. sgz302251]|uniref:immunoglobulin-like domain-containing protein n=1 Tax=Paenibacillus sp. sgz302251 TaxID=3414493 RepID=UPI003C7EB326